MVDAESKVAVRPVTVAQQDDTRAVISDGLKAEEQVVTTGFTRLSNGTRVARAGGRGRAAATRRRRRRRRMRRRPSAGASAEGGRRSADGKERRRSENAPATPSAKQ